MMNERNIWIALPVMQESQWLGFTLEAIKSLQYPNLQLVICINQPDSFSGSDANQKEKNIYTDNQVLLNELKTFTHPWITLLDKSSPGQGWPEGKGSVGAARRFIMNHISQNGADEDIILSLDADTTFGTEYFQSVNQIFNEHPEITGLSNPYYHKYTGNDDADRAMLRYEIYMRNYAINLFRIDNPYRFTALGSAMATTVKTFKDIGGLTPKISGEDFYFLQKLLKKGPLYLDNKELVYPAARFSNRVYFGTGPAMIKGNQGDWSSYPIYSYRLFDNIKRTREQFPALYYQDISTPIDELLRVKETNIWEKLRRNSTSQEQFMRACDEKVDGLRILQYLKEMHKKRAESENRVLINNLEKFEISLPEKIKNHLLEQKDLSGVLTHELSTIRDLLFRKERQLQTQKPITHL